MYALNRRHVSANLVLMGLLIALSFELTHSFGIVHGKPAPINAMKSHPVIHRSNVTRLAESDPLVDLFKSITADVAKGIAGKVQDIAFGWALNILGFGSGPSLTDVMQKLDVIENKIDMLKHDLDNFQLSIMEALSQLQFNIHKDVIQLEMNPITSAMEAYRQIIASNTTHAKDFIDSLVKDSILNFNNGIAQHLNNIHSGLSEGSTALLRQFITGIGMAWNKCLSQQSTCQMAWDTALRCYQGCRTYFTPNDIATQVFKFYHQYLAVQVQGIYLIIEALHYTGDTAFATVKLQDFNKKIDDQVDLLMYELSVILNTQYPVEPMYWDEVEYHSVPVAWLPDLTALLSDTVRMYRPTPMYMYYINAPHRACADEPNWPSCPPTSAFQCISTLPITYEYTNAQNQVIPQTAMPARSFGAVHYEDYDYDPDFPITRKPCLHDSFFSIYRLNYYEGMKVRIDGQQDKCGVSLMPEDIVTGGRALISHRMYFSNWFGEISTAQR